MASQMSLPNDALTLTILSPGYSAASTYVSTLADKLMIVVKNVMTTPCAA